MRIVGIGFYEQTFTYLRVCQSINNSVAVLRLGITQIVDSPQLGEHVKAVFLLQTSEQRKQHVGSMDGRKDEPAIVPELTGDKYLPETVSQCIEIDGHDDDS